MKNIFLPIFAFVMCGGVFADISGDYNTWLGYLAGINASGNRTTVMGAGAGGEATGLYCTDFMGAAAGAYSYNMTNCVGIGFKALHNAHDMSGVVAIGTDAFAGVSYISDATWLNGHFVVNDNEFYIAPDRNTRMISATNKGKDLHFLADGTVDIAGGDVVLACGSSHLGNSFSLSARDIKTGLDGAQQQIDMLKSALTAATNRIAALEAKLAN
jgi:hypothetical protein